MSEESASAPEKNSILSGFKEFLMRGNVVELAVAVVIGAAFSKIVNAVVSGVINPLVGAIGTQDLSEYQFCLTATCVVDPETGEIVEGIPISWGPVLSAALTFLITAAVVYFLMILPMNKYKERQAAKQPVVEEPATETELQILAQIRDSLVSQRTGSADSAPSPNGDGPRPDASVTQQRTSVSAEK